MKKVRLSTKLISAMCVIILLVFVAVEYVDLQDIAAQQYFSKHNNNTELAKLKRESDKVQQELKSKKAAAEGQNNSGNEILKKQIESLAQQESKLLEQGKEIEKKIQEIQTKK